MQQILRSLPENQRHPTQHLWQRSIPRPGSTAHWPQRWAPDLLPRGLALPGAHTGAEPSTTAAKRHLETERPQHQLSTTTRKSPAHVLTGSPWLLTPAKASQNLMQS